MEVSEPFATQFFLLENIDQSEPSATEEFFLPAQTSNQSEQSATEEYFLSTQTIGQSEPFATEEYFRPEHIEQSEPSATDLFRAETELFDLMDEF